MVNVPFFFPLRIEALSSKSALNQGKNTVDSLATTDASDLAFVSQFFNFLPRRVEIRGQQLIGHGLPLLHVCFLECNRPVDFYSSLLETAIDTSETHQ